MHLSFPITMHHTNCDDTQTDQSLFWSYFPQMKVSGKQNQSQKRCEARDVSNAQTSPFVCAISVISLVHVQPNSIQTIRLCDQIHFVDSS